MDRNNYLDFTRLSNFVQRQAVLNLNTMLVAAGAVFGILLVISLAIAYFDGNPDSSENLKITYRFVFFLAGYVFTSRVFSELHSPQKSYAYLTLPVSTTEKVIGSWLLSSPVYVLGYWIMISIIFLITKLITGTPVTIGLLFDRGFFNAVGTYMVTQTIYFLGAVYFRKNNFLKTILSLFVLIVFIGLYSGLLVWLLFGGSISGQDFPKGEMQITGPGDIIGQIAEIFFIYILGPFMLIVSYFRLKERQV